MVVVMKNLATNEKSTVKNLNLLCYMNIWTALLFLAGFIAYFYTKEKVIENLYLILISPSKLITDYFNLGGLSASFINAGICGLFCNIMCKVFNVKPSSSILSGYFLVIAHCFYGLNILNMLPLFFGVIVFCVITKKSIKEYLHIAMFATSLGPFISDFLFRYTLPAGTFIFGTVQLSVSGIILAIVFSLASGFIVPALIPGMTAMHKGYNLFKAGLAIGFFGMFAFALFYNVLGIDTPDVLVRDNHLYNLYGKSYLLFINLFFITVFLITFLIGLFLNGKSLRGYSSIWKCDGLNDDFYERFGPSLTYINIGLYGFAILGFLNIIFLIAKGVGFTGPTTGIIIAAITFSTCGQTIKNVWPIALGFVITVGLTSLLCHILNISMVWEISSQVFINSFAFATGLCPFSGRYGWKIGALSGAICAIICGVTINMHGGFVLYNGGLTAGLTAMLLLPILEFYKVKQKEVVEDN